MKLPSHLLCLVSYSLTSRTGQWPYPLLPGLACDDCMYSFMMPVYDDWDDWDDELMKLPSHLLAWLTSHSLTCLAQPAWPDQGPRLTSKIKWIGEPDYFPLALNLNTG